ncbi:MAG: family 1 encapsulin nanocompartment shell protein [Pseudomonadales bacterium]|jgi:uncharacterized linocin/CFP29 family protein
MDDLNRGLAPISNAAWTAIDDEAKTELELILAGRRVVDLVGPLGWDTCAVGTGRLDSLDEHLVPGVESSIRRNRPLVEIRSYFELARDELEAIDRGAKDPDLQPVKQAAQIIGRAEDRAIFHGYKAAGIEGIGQAAARDALVITSDYERYPSVVARAIAKLRRAGVGGPYTIALGPRCFTGLTETTTESGFPVIEHVERLVDGPIIWAPAIRGAVVASLRGGDFELTLGRDFSIGYRSHTDRTVKLYIEESFTYFGVCPEAAVPLVYEDEREHTEQKLDEALDETFPASDPVELAPE